MSLLPFGSRILILVAHPDDEIVGFAAAVMRAKSQGAEVFTLYCTDGCIAVQTLWPWQRRHHASGVATRRAEAERAAALLGLVPVGWSSRPARHLWRALPQIAAEVRAAIAVHDIDQLWVPAYEGGNADHDGLNAIGRYFLKGSLCGDPSFSPPAGEVRWGGDPHAETVGDASEPVGQASPPHPRPLPRGEGSRCGISVLEFAEYNFHQGCASAQTFPYPNGTEQTLFLTPEEQATKRQALALYASERGNLGYVGTQRECFRPLALYDYNRPPHGGTLWYARFQWVPFRHPRVDFTRPAEVSAAITAFLSATTTAPPAPAT